MHCCSVECTSVRVKVIDFGILSQGCEFCVGSRRDGFGTPKMGGGSLQGSWLVSTVAVSSTPGTQRGSGELGWDWEPPRLVVVAIAPSWQLRNCMGLDVVELEVLKEPSRTDMCPRRPLGVGQHSQEPQAGISWGCSWCPSFSFSSCCS